MTPTAMVVERTRANMVLPRERSWLLDAQVSAHGGKGAIARRAQSARRNAGIDRADRRSDPELDPSDVGYGSRMRLRMSAKARPARRPSRFAVDSGSLTRPASKS